MSTSAPTKEDVGSSAFIALPVVDHSAAAAKFTGDDKRTEWHDESLWMVRRKRDVAAASVPEWETLRQLASDIKEHTLGRLGEYLAAFEQRATENGVQVHWAADGDEHNRIVMRILADAGAKRLVKSKSMLTEECGLNEHLEQNGVEVVDTDLGERIVQLAGEPPSHIVMPAIHYKKEEIGELFHRTMGTDAGASDPKYLTEAARTDLRARFFAADAALTGVNFAIAETGGVVVCTNEGNADLGVHLAPIHIASMGIEKLIPRAENLGVFLRLLARSATGQALTSYSSHFHKPQPGKAMHIILVDNGRSEHLAKPTFRNALKCIRCAACMNTCPVYRRSGGHSYGSPVPGPIGSILAPNRDAKRFAALPYASTLCGSCSDVCPVKIDIHEQLYAWRQEETAMGLQPLSKRATMWIAGRILGSPRAYRAAGAMMRWALKRAPRAFVYNKRNVWSRERELPVVPKESFREWYIRTGAGGEATATASSDARQLSAGGPNE